MRRVGFVVVLGFAVVGWACSSDEFAGGDAGPDVATPSEGGVDAPSDAAPDAAPRTFLYVFVTSAPHVGQFEPADGGSGIDGRSGADAFCTQLADASGSVVPGRRWTAWLSWAPTGGDARDRLPRTLSGDLTFEYRLTDGVTTVFPKGFNFDVLVDGGPSVPSAPIRMDERKKVLQSQAVWTGTTQDGRARAGQTHCGGWNVADLTGLYGALGDSADRVNWSFSGNFGAPLCSESHALYCFEAP